MDTDKFFDEVYEHLKEELAPSSVTLHRADETIVFRYDGEHTGLEVPKSDIESLFEYFKRYSFGDNEEQCKDRVKGKVKQDSCQYLVLKYL